MTEDFSSNHLELVTTKLHQKVTDLEQAHGELAAKESELRLITNAVPVLISFVDAGQRFRFVNQQYREWFGQTPEALRSQTLAEVFGSKAYSQLRGHIEQALAGDAVTFETSLNFSGGAIRYIRASFMPETGAGGFIALIEDLTELRTTEVALREANEALGRSNQLLRQFAQVFAHDLRESARQVAMFADLVARQARDKLNEEETQSIGYCQTGARRIIDLVAGLSLITQLSGETRRRHEISLSDPNQVLDFVLRELQVIIEESGARVVIQSDLPSLRIPIPHLLHLFRNLIANAIKFRHPERPPEIVVAIGNEGEISIKDNGIGIAAKYQAKVFSLFRPLHGSDYPGTGLGLALCQRIVEQYGGRIWLESEPECGTTVHFTIPGAGEITENAAGAA